MATKKEISSLQHNSMEYIVKHGEWRLKRGKPLSAILIGPFNYRNPQEAYRIAKEILSKPAVKRNDIFLRSGQTRLEAFLGIPSPYDALWPGARKVPYTCYEWY